ARLCCVGYLAAAGELAHAEQELTILARDFPAEVGVLKLGVAVTVAQSKVPAAGSTPAAAQQAATAAADRRIQQFIAAYPQQLAARYYWAEWLVATNRADAALAYLEDAANFPGTTDDTHRSRLRALAHLLRGERDKSRAALEGLPHDP